MMIDEQALYEVRGNAQQALADASITMLREQVLVVGCDAFGDLATVEESSRDGIELMLLPIAEAISGDAEHPDLSIWHVMGHDGDGEWLEFDHDLDPPPPDGYPSVLNVHRAGLEPEHALVVIRETLANDLLDIRFGFRDNFRRARNTSQASHITTRPTSVDNALHHQA